MIFVSGNLRSSIIFDNQPNTKLDETAQVWAFYGSHGSLGSSGPIFFSRSLAALAWATNLASVDSKGSYPTPLGCFEIPGDARFYCIFGRLQSVQKLSFD